MQAIDMVSRPSLPTTEQTKASINKSRQERELALASEGRHGGVPRRPVILDAFDKIILDDPDQTVCLL